MPTSLISYFRAHAAARTSLVLATVIGTEGSTYRKPGAQMLLAGDGSSTGLLSGGCLESDLAERARRVLATSRAEIATYDARTSDDPIWGLGLGCEGAMRILLSRIDATNGYQPYAFIAARSASHTPAATALVIESNAPRYPLGHSWNSESTTEDSHALQVIERCRGRAAEGGFETARIHSADLSLTVFICALDLPARLLILGGGPDASPVVEIASLLGWRVTVGDHRSAYLTRARFAEDVALVELEPQRLLAEISLADFDAAVVMSHNLESDARYLRALAASSMPYIGLLGPAARRRRLLADLGDAARRLGDRLYGPVGLDIGARTPEAIAVAIVAEIQAFFAGRQGAPFRVGAHSATADATGESSGASD